MQHVQQIQNPVSGSGAVPNLAPQQFYQGTTPMQSYPANQIYQQNVSQPVAYHSYPTSSTNGHVDVISNQQPQVFTTNQAGSNAVATSMGYIQPMPVQASLSQPVQNVSTVTSAAAALQVRLLNINKNSRTI